MAKNHYGKKTASRRNNGRPGQYILIFCAFIIGYVSSNADLTKLTHWFNSNVLTQSSPPVSTKPQAQQAQLPKPKFEFYTLLANGQAMSQPVQSNTVQTSNVQPTVNSANVVPTNTTVTAATNTNPAIHAETVPPIDLTVTQKLPLHEPLAVTAENKALPTAPLSKDAYLIQVGSFKNLHEAERMRATLLMKGFEVKIVTVSQQRMNWYRVHIGPYATHSQALKAQAAFARSEHITGMIRKMNA